MLLSRDLAPTNSWQSLFWAASFQVDTNSLISWQILQIPHDMIAWLWLWAMGSDSSHCPSLSIVLKKVAWRHLGSAAKHVDIATSLNPCGHGFSHGGVGVRHEIPRHRALAGWPAAPGMEDGWWQKPGAAAATPGRTGGGGKEDEGSTEGGHAGIGDAGGHCALWCAASSKEACGDQGGGGEREWIWERSCWDQSWLGLKLA